MLGLGQGINAALRGRWWPGACMMVALLAGIPAIMLSAPLTCWLEFDRQAILGGELWRLFTGHLTHWTFGHLCWDLLACLLAVGFLLVHRPKALLPLALWSMLAVSLGVLLADPEIAIYRGLSGVDTALFAYVAAALGLTAARRGERRAAVWGVGLLCLIAVKILHEMGSGTCLFVDAATFIPLASAHLGGLLAGASYALAERVLGASFVRRGLGMLGGGIKRLEATTQAVEFGQA